MMFAYDELYLSRARETFGCMLDFAVNVLGCDLRDYYDRLLISGVANQFENGVPGVLVGRSGSELALEVLGLRDVPQACIDSMLQSSVEYWTGWALAYYQWSLGASFRVIDKFAPIEQIWQMYWPYHEMDILQFCDAMEQLRMASQMRTPLQERRVRAGLSQSQLARLSSVPVRTIQQYEQRQKDINRAQFRQIIALSRALCCAPEDLFEYRCEPCVDYAAVTL